MTKVKNILIFSSENDISTNYVMDWIYYLGHNPIRYNGFDLFKGNSPFLFDLDNNEFCFIDKKKTLNLPKEIHSVWYRKNGNKDSFLSNQNDKNLFNKANEHIQKENIILKRDVFSSLDSKRSLGKRISNPPSKFQMLISAKKAGLKTPATIVTNNKKEFEKFYKKHQRAITKTIGDGFFFKAEDGVFVSSYTEELTLDVIQKMTDSFSPSLFQESIVKDFEIRTFFLDKKCYSMAIFSQLDEQTNVDFRMYNVKKQNRSVPFKLPDEIENKIVTLMKNLELSTGSLDLIKSINGDYYFLEVNPWGQFSMTSVPCNYNLEEKIAKFLLDEE